MLAVPLRRGQIVLAELDPVVGEEQSKTRAVLIVSNDGANASVSQTGRGVVTILPFTSNVTEAAALRPFQVVVPAAESGLQRDSVAQAEQVRSIAVARIVRSLGFLSTASMAAIDEALRVHLSL